MDPKLIKAYTDTDYHILPLELIVKIGVINSRLDYEMEKQSWLNYAIITAWNPRSEPSAYEDNLIQNLKLLKDLVENDFVIYPALGKSKQNFWKPEESWCVFNITRNFALELGTKYNQYAIVYAEINKAPELLYCRAF